MPSNQLKKRFFVLDDDPMITEMLTYGLEKRGYEVTSSTSSTGALQKIEKLKPYCVIIDIMMPTIDGIELCRKIKKLTSCHGVKVFILSSKEYDADKQRAIDAGADGYLTKSNGVDASLDKVEMMLEEHLLLRFWGVRGSLPVSGKELLKYGGHTSCVSINFPDDKLLIIDAGTGIQTLGEYLAQTRAKGNIGKILISHPHWDHINAIPFFKPLYIPGNTFEICGPAQGKLSIKKLIEKQMDTIFFPVKTNEFAAKISYRDLKEETFKFSNATIKTKLLNHPGMTLGYRIEYGKRVICYISDNELYNTTDNEYNTHYFESLQDFIRSADVLIIDCSYSDEAYLSKKNWGHSCPSQVCRLAAGANISTMYLFHHDLLETDADVDKKHEQALEILHSLNSKVVCFAAKEGESLRIPMKIAR